MARRLDRILVVESSPRVGGEPPAGQMSKVKIECRGGRGSAEPRAARNLDRPALDRQPYCTQLTTLTQADVDAGIPLAEACRVLADEYESRERLFASFGDYDAQQFERNCAAFGISYPFGPTHLNVKNLMAVAYGWSRKVGMSEALKRAGLPLEGTHHRGGDDAWNIAGLLCQLLRRIRGR